MPSEPFLTTTAAPVALASTAARITGALPG